MKTLIPAPGPTVRPAPLPAPTLLAALRRWRLMLLVERAGLQARGAAGWAAVADVLAAAAALRDMAEHVRPAGRAARAEVRAEPRVDARSGPGCAEVARPLRVLVVDDLAMLRRLMVRQLAAAGHAVVGEAGTVADAVARAHALSPDVLVLDVHLPDGLGTEVAARVAAGPAPGPGVVFCTGDPAGALAVGAGCAAACGGDWAILEKPVPAAALDRAVREAAARRRPRS